MNKNIESEITNLTTRIIDGVKYQKARQEEMMKIHGRKMQSYQDSPRGKSRTAIKRDIITLRQRLMDLYDGLC
jgi:hypothetical protein